MMLMEFYVAKQRAHLSGSLQHPDVDILPVHATSITQSLCLLSVFIQPLMVAAAVTVAASLFTCRSRRPRHQTGPIDKEDDQLHYDPMTPPNQPDSI